MAAHDLRKFGNYEITYVLFGFVWRAGIATQYTKVHIHIDTLVPTYIRTTQTNIGTETSRPHTHL